MYLIFVRMIIFLCSDDTALWILNMVIIFYRCIWSDHLCYVPFLVDVFEVIPFMYVPFLVTVVCESVSESSYNSAIYWSIVCEVQCLPFWSPWMHFPSALAYFLLQWFFHAWEHLWKASIGMVPRSAVGHLLFLQIIEF